MAKEKEVYPDEEQGIIPEESSEDTSLDMETGEKDEDVYSEEGGENLVEDGEISPAEEGFMEGAEGKGEMGTCAHCGKPLKTDDKSEIVEKETKGELLQFCSDECASAGAQDQE